MRSNFVHPSTPHPAAGRRCEYCGERFTPTHNAHPRPETDEHELLEVHWVEARKVWQLWPVCAPELCFEHQDGRHAYAQLRTMRLFVPTLPHVPHVPALPQPLTLAPAPAPARTLDGVLAIIGQDVPSAPGGKRRMSAPAAVQERPARPRVGSPARPKQQAENATRMPHRAGIAPAAAQRVQPVMPARDARGRFLPRAGR